MAIRIDLLPGYVGLKRWFKRIAAICALLVVAFAAVLGLLYYSEQLRLQTLKTNRENIETFAKKTEAAEKAASDAEGQAKPFQDNVNFFVDAGRTGAERAALLDLIHRYIYAGALVGSIDISDGQNAKMTAAVRTPDDYARFLLNLRRGTVPAGVLFADLAAGTGILGYPNKSGAAATAAGGAAAPAAPVVQPVGAIGTSSTSNITYYVLPNSITAGAKLREPIVIPVPPGDAAPAAAGPGGAPLGGPPGPPPTPPKP